MGGQKSNSVEYHDAADFSIRHQLRRHCWDKHHIFPPPKGNIVRPRFTVPRVVNVTVVPLCDTSYDSTSVMLARFCSMTRLTPSATLRAVSALSYVDSIFPV